MTTVAIDAFQLRPSAKGVSRVLANLTPRLLAMEDSGTQYVALTTAAGAGLLGAQFARFVLVVPDMPDSIWTHCGLPFYADQVDADLLYLTREVGPLWGPPFVLHVFEDPRARWARIPPNAWRTRGRALLDRATMRSSLGRARVLATSSRATAEQLAVRFGISQSRFREVPLGVDSVFEKLEPGEMGGTRPHIFHLGSEDERDNTLAVLKTYAWLRAHHAADIPPLVIGGRLGKLAAPVSTIIREAALSECMSVLGRVPDDELRRLYAGAVVCVQPSSDEGFGLQPLEAMAAGAPVIALDTPSAREVLGSAVELVPAASPEVLGSAIARLLSDRAYREQLARRGQQRSREYTWDKTAGLVNTLVERALQMDPLPAPPSVDRAAGDRVSRHTRPITWPPFQARGLRRRGENSSRSAVRLMVLTSIIAPYRIPVFNALADLEGIELRVIYLAETAPNRDWPIYRDEIRHDYAILEQIAAMRTGHSCMHLSGGILHELRTWRPDVVVGGGWDQPVILVAHLLRRVFGYRFSWWVESTERDLRSRLRIPTSFKKLLLAGSDSVIVPGTASTQYVERLGARPERIAVAPNAVDMRFFSAHRRDTRSPVARCKFLYVGRLHSTKGLDTLLDAWRLLRSHLANLTIVGDGPARSHLARRVTLEGLSSVHLTGHLNREALAAEYASADVFVFPSLSDPWGLVLNEAMAFGLPVVTTPAPGAVYDLVTDGWNGFVVPPKDAVALAESMKELAADPIRRAEMGHRSLERIADFDPEQCAKGLAAGARKALLLSAV